MYHKSLYYIKYQQYKRPTWEPLLHLVPMHIKQNIWLLNQKEDR